MMWGAEQNRGLQIRSLKRIDGARRGLHYILEDRMQEPARLKRDGSGRMRFAAVLFFAQWFSRFWSHDLEWLGMRGDSPYNKEWLFVS
jgi:hypothetical protein